MVMALEMRKFRLLFSVSCYVVWIPIAGALLQGVVSTSDRRTAALKAAFDAKAAYEKGAYDKAASIDVEASKQRLWADMSDYIHGKVLV